MNKVPEEEKEFAKLVVATLEKSVSYLQKEGANRGLTYKQIRKVLLLTFKILGEKAGISYRQLISNLLHSK